MQESVPSPGVVQATFAATLFDEWCRSGLRDVVVCPGSRSTPFALAALKRDEVTLHVRIDERSAAFFALGRALMTRRPVAVVVTSGTAAAEVHAAVIEADLSNVPLLVLTADRPPELHGVGAAQTIDQRELYGRAVRRFEEPGVARHDARSSWRALASRLWLDALGVDASAGPVHLNAAFVEPLVSEPGPIDDGRALGRPWRVSTAVASTVDELALQGQRVVLIAGHGVDVETISRCHALEWVVLGDATAQGSLPYFDALLRCDDFAALARPDVVVRVGGLPASKVLGERLRQWRTRVVAMTGAGPVADPDGIVTEVVSGALPSSADGLRGDVPYARFWHEASGNVGSWLEQSEDDDVWLSEPTVARAVVAMSSSLSVPLMVGSSMPVRDVEWWASPRTVPTFSNRGANGIDGVVSTILGIGAGSSALGLIGDVTLLHDVSGLVDGLGESGGSCVIVVVDNRGGGIFSFLPQATMVDEEDFERLFGTARVHDPVVVAEAFGHRGVRVATRGELRDAVSEGLSRPGLTVVAATVADRDENVRYHDALNDAVRSVWRNGTE